MANNDINLAPTPDYDSQLAAIQRRQKIADMLSQQSQQPIDINSYNGIQAPISPLSALVKGLQGFSGSYLARKGDEATAALKQQDSAAADALVKQLTQQAPATPASTTAIDATAPTLSSGAPTVQSPAQATISGAAPMPAMSQQEQLAALLSAHGGPETAAIRGAMLPQIMQRQNADYQHQLGRDDKTWEAAQPMPVARQQEIAATGAQTQANAKAANLLPPTAYQTGELANSRNALAETHSYHQQQAANDAFNQEAKKNSVFSHDDLMQMAEQGWQGDKSIFQNLGRGTQGAQNIVGLRKAMYEYGGLHGKTPAELAQMNAQFQGVTAEQRKIGGRAGSAKVSTEEFGGLADLSREAYAKLPRDQFVPYNQLKALVANKTSSPEQAAALSADYGAVQAYARSLSPNGIGSLENSRKAENLLSSVTSAEAHDAVLNQMRKEIAAVKYGADTAMGRHESTIPQPGGNSAAPNTGQKLSPAEAAKLPPDTPFIGLDGVQRRTHK